MAHSSPTYDYMQLQNQGRSSSRSTDALLGQRQQPAARSVGSASVPAPAAPNLIGNSPTTPQYWAGPSSSKRSPSSGASERESSSYDSAAAPAETLLENLRIACNYAVAPDIKVERSSKFSRSMDQVLKEGERCLKKIERELQQTKEDARNLKEVNGMLNQQLQEAQAMVEHEKGARRRENAELKMALERIQDLESKTLDTSLLSKLEKKDLVCLVRHMHIPLRLLLTQSDHVGSKPKGKLRWIAFRRRSSRER